MRWRRVGCLARWPSGCHFLLVPAIVAATDYVAALSEAIARTFIDVWPLRLFKPPLVLDGAWVQAIWHERTHASAAHAWLRGIIADIGREVHASCRKGR